MLHRCCIEKLCAFTIPGLFTSDLNYSKNVNEVLFRALQARTLVMHRLLKRASVHVQ